MRLTDDLDLLDAIREAGRLMAADPRRFTGHVRVNVLEGGITNVNVDISIKLNGGTKSAG
mgnify:FL=1